MSFKVEYCVLLKKKKIYKIFLFFLVFLMRFVVRLVELFINYKVLCVGIIFISIKFIGKCVFLFRNSYLISNS